MSHRHIQMICKKPRDAVSDKAGFRAHSLPAPMPICYILNISVIYDNIQLSAKYIDNKKLHEVDDMGHHICHVFCL